MCLNPHVILLINRKYLRGKHARLTMHKKQGPPLVPTKSIISHTRIQMQPRTRPTLYATGLSIGPTHHRCANTVEQNGIAKLKM